MAYFALLLYTAILFIRPQEWVSFMQGWPVLDFVVGFAIITWLAHFLRHEWKVSDAPQNWLMLGLFVAVLMSHVRHTYLAAFLEDFQEFGKVLIIYLLIASVANSVKRVRTFVFVIVAGSLFMSVHGILQAHFGAGFGGQQAWFEKWKTTRVVAFGIFNDPNDLALMLVATLPFVFSRAFDRNSSAPRRALSAAATVPMLYCIYLTNSRGGWLALAVMAMAFAYVHLPSRKMGVVLALSAIPLVFALGPSRVETMTTDDGAVRGRLVAWGQGNRMLKRWPVFGAGKGRFTEFSEDGRVAHNSLVQCWAELGLFGYFFWLGLVLATLKDGWAMSKLKAPAEGGEESADMQELPRLARAGFVGLIGFLGGAFFLTRTFIHPLYLLFALVAALRSFHEREVGHLEGGFVLSDSRYVFLAALASIPALWLLIRILNAL